MGIIADTLRRLSAPRAFAPNPVAASLPVWQAGSPAFLGGNYLTYAREGYAKNEIIYSAIELRATSAAEPHIIGRRKVSQQRRRAIRSQLVARRVHALQADYIVDQLREDVTDHPAIAVLNRPNPFMSRFRFWSTIIMHRDIAGNAYAWKMRDGRQVKELWVLRPDRVKVIPDRQNFIGGYEYRNGQERVELAAEDVIHWKTRHPYDEYYGMPPLMAIAGRIDIDNYMRDFVGAFFRNGGNPGAVLAVKQKLSQEAKDEIRQKHRRQFGGSGGWFDLMILDQAEASYTPTTANLGARGLVVPELNAISEARLSMIFGVPLSILGALTGQESSSYANKRQDWQVLWDITLAPLYVDLSDTLNLSLLPDYGDLDEFVFDLSDVKALQEDTDKLHERARKNVQAGVWTLEEGRALTGVEPVASDGYYLIPANILPTPASSLDNVPSTVPAALVRALVAPYQVAMPTVMAEVRCPACGRLVAKDVMGQPELYCPRCKETFRPPGD